MGRLTNPAFDYTQLSKNDKGKLLYFEGELGRSRKRVADELIKHGEILHKAQQLLADYSGGTFVAWLESQGITTSTAYNYVDAYVAFASFPNLENLEVSAMYALAKNAEAKKKAMKLADNGVRVTHAMAQKLIEEATIPKLTRGSGASGETSRGHSGESLPPTPPPPDSDPAEPDQETDPRPPRKGKDGPGVTAKTGRAAEVWQARQVLKGWADAVGRWMNGNPAGIDVYREQFPGEAGDRVIEAAKELCNALDAWKRALK